MTQNTTIVDPTTATAATTRTTTSPSSRLISSSSDRTSLCSSSEAVAVTTVNNNDGVAVIYSPTEQPLSSSSSPSEHCHCRHISPPNRHEKKQGSGAVGGTHQQQRQHHSHSSRHSPLKVRGSGRPSSSGFVFVTCSIGNNSAYHHYINHNMLAILRITFAFVSFVAVGSVARFAFLEQFDMNARAYTYTNLMTGMQQQRETSSSSLLLSQQQRQSYPSFVPPPGMTCAINLYGLPRAFKSLVLPSLIENVIKPNAQYGCDYYVHYYTQEKEPAGRSGSGGTIDPNEIRILENELLLQQSSASIQFTTDTEEDFYTTYDYILKKIRTKRDPQGNYYYFPYADKTYQYSVTTDNIMKMWHSIRSVWNLMEAATTTKLLQQRQQQQQRQTSSRPQESIKQHYDRVAMLRADVVYVTPIDIWSTGKSTDFVGSEYDINNQYAVIPGFGRHPISDRLIYGPYHAVKVWAAQRFARMEEHVKNIYDNVDMRGHGLHSERFIQYTIIPAIEQQPGIAGVLEHDKLCFFRVRADESVWVTDCAPEQNRPVALPSIQEHLGKTRDRYKLKAIARANRAVVERVIGRTCGTLTHAENPRRESLDCSIQTSTNQRLRRANQVIIRGPPSTTTSTTT